MLLDSLFKNNKSNKNLQYAKMLDGSYPAFSQFGKNIYIDKLSCIVYYKHREKRYHGTTGRNFTYGSFNFG